MPSFSLIEVFNNVDLHFRGNTAVVTLTEEPLEESKMQELASDFNQPATTFLWPAGGEDEFHVRWYAPDEEIGLCGHGSLAASVFLSERLGEQGNIKLLYRDGSIMVKDNGNSSCTIRLRAIPVLSQEAVPRLLQQALGIPLQGYFITSNKHLVLAEKEQDVRHMVPDFALLRELETFGYAVTAPGEQVDFVSRTLVPHVQQLEDPATGSSHAALAPFWASRLNKDKLVSHQLSARGGKFLCEFHHGDVVSLTGEFRIIANGDLHI